MGSPALVAVDDDHVVMVLMKLRSLLPEADVSKLVHYFSGTKLAHVVNPNQANCLIS